MSSVGRGESGGLDATAKAALTLGVLVLLLLGAAWWGWSALTAPLPDSGKPPVCVETTVAAGEEVFRDQVSVGVYNSGRRSGLAGATMAQLEDRGFAPAGTGNAPRGTDVKRVQIWAADKNDPAVELVRRQFRKAPVKDGPALGPGVVVVVGDQFRPKLPGKGVESVVAEQDATICSPPDAA